MNASLVRLSVVIISHGHEDLLPDCVGSLGTALDGIASEILVIDNLPNGGAAAALQSAAIPVRHHRNQSSVGLSENMNQAAAQTTGEYLLFLNPDTAYKNGSLSGALDFMDTTRQAAVMGCRLLNSDGTTQQSFRRFPTAAVILARGLGADHWPRRPRFYDRRMMAEEALDEPAEVDWVFGAFILARREHFMAVGGMDVRYRLYYEDVDLCFRLRQKGLRTIYYPMLVFLHHHARTSAGSPLSRLWRWHLRSAFRFLTQHGFSVRSPSPDRLA